MSGADEATQAAIDAGERWLHRDLLPGESIDGGLNLHSVHVMQTTENVVIPLGSDGANPGARSAPVTRLWVPADEFMAVQKERDDYRIACCLVNAEEVGSHDWAVVRRVLARVGLSLDTGRAHLALNREFGGAR